MDKSKLIATLIVLLVIVIAFMGVLYVYSNENKIESRINDSTVSENKIITISKDVEIYDKRTIVTDKFVNEIDANGEIIIIGKNGAYSIKKGVVLVNDRVVTIKDEKVSIYDIKNPTKSISSD